MTDPSPTWPFQSRGLTLQQSRVLALLCDGMSNDQIADAMFLGVETIRSHLQSIYRSIRVRTRTEAILWAFSSRELPDFAAS